MVDGTSGPSPPVDADDDGRDRVHQRKRSRSLLEKLGLTAVGIGLLVLVFTTVATHRPATVNPLEITMGPVVGLTAVAGAGILLVFFGFLAYYFGRKART